MKKKNKVKPENIKKISLNEFQLQILFEKLDQLYNHGDGDLDEMELQIKFDDESKKILEVKVSGYVKNYFEDTINKEG